MSQTSSAISVKIEDALVYAIPFVVALSGFNWASLIPGTTNAFFTAITLGFLAKFLVGIQQNGWSSWEDWIPTLSISLGFVAQTLSSDPNYLYAATVIGFIVKSLGYFTDTGEIGGIEDLFLGGGAFLIAYGAYISNPGLVSLGTLLALVGKTVPSVAGGTTPTSPATVPPVPTTSPPTTSTTLPIIAVSPSALEPATGPPSV